MRAAATRTAREPERRMDMGGQFKARAAAASNLPPPAPELPLDAPAPLGAEHGRSERRHYARALATGMTPSTPPPDERPERPRDPDHDRSDADDRDVPLDEPDRTEPPIDED